MCDLCGTQVIFDPDFFKEVQDKNKGLEVITICYHCEDRAEKIEDDTKVAASFQRLEQ